MAVQRIETVERERDEYHAEVDRLNELIMTRTDEPIRHMGDALTHPDDWPACRECHDDWPCLPFYEELGAMLLRFDAAERERDAERSRAEHAYANYVQLMRDVGTVERERDRIIDAHSYEMRQRESLEAQNAELRAVLEEILEYSGGADNALEDEYVIERAQEALARTPEDDRDA